MTANDAGSWYAIERSRAEARFRRALVASLAVHLALAGVWRGQLQPSRPVGHSALSVEFRALAPAPPASPVVEEARELAANRPRILTSPRAAEAIAEDDANRNPEARQRPGPFIAVAPSSRPAEGSQPTDQVPGGDTVRRGDRPGEVSVVLVINDDGYAQRIIWQQLPAMSPEQFRRLENRLRSRAYHGRAGQAISETIDVLAMLRGEARDSAVVASPASPPPAGAAGDPR